MKMMMHYKSVLSVVLILPMIIAAGACSSGGDRSIVSADSPTLSDETKAETARLYPDHESDYKGAGFTVLYFDAVKNCGWSDLPCDVDEPQQVGEALSDAVYIRNRKIEEMYNVKLNAIGYFDTNSDCPIIKKQVLAGDTEYDLVFPAWNALYSLINGQCLYDLEGLFDFSMPWFDAKSRSAFSILGKTYAVISDATYMDKMLAIVVFFNQKMAGDYSLGNLYQLVIDHEWTFDNMLQMCELIYDDINGNQKVDKEDSFGFISQADATYELYNSSGQYYCSIGDDGIPYQAINNELSVGIMQKIVSFMNEERLFFNRQTNNVSTIEVCNMFAENRGLFLLRQVQAAFELRNMDADFGIIPSPLMYEGQEDYHTSIGYTVAFTNCIPAVVKNVEMSAVMLDTLAAESYYNVNDVLYEVILGDKLFRDSDSKQNLDIIMDNRIYDPGCVYNFGNISGDWFTNYTKGADQVSSVIAANESKVNKAIEKFVESLRND